MEEGSIKGGGNLPIGNAQVTACWCSSEDCRLHGCAQNRELKECERYWYSTKSTIDACPVGGYPMRSPFLELKPKVFEVDGVF